MNKQIKKKWLKALRTPADEGGYHQGRHRLVTPLANGEYRFCCLGVLQNLYHLDSNTTFKEDNFFTPRFSAEVGKWAGLPVYQISITNLIGLNDSSAVSFMEIADYIERNL